jgi:hypothetical protein
MTEHQRLLLGIGVAAAVVLIVVVVVVGVAVRRHRRRRREAEAPLLVPASATPAGLVGSGTESDGSSEVGEGARASLAPVAAGPAAALAREGGSGSPASGPLGTALDRLLHADLEVDELVEQLSASSPLVVSYSVRVEPGFALPESWRVELIRLLVDLLRCPERVEERPAPLLSPLASRANISLELRAGELELVVGFDGPIGRHWSQPGVSISQEQAARLAVASWSGGASVHYRLPLLEPGPALRERSSSLVSKLP